MVVIHKVKWQLLQLLLAILCLVGLSNQAHAQGPTTLIKLFVNRSGRAIRMVEYSEATILAKRTVQSLETKSPRLMSKQQALESKVYDYVVDVLESNDIHIFKKEATEIELTPNSKAFKKLENIKTLQRQFGRIATEHFAGLARRLDGVSRADVYISIPSNETEYHNIFTGSRYDASVELISNSIRCCSDNVGVLNSYSDLKSILQTGNNRPIIIVGHNDGGALMFPDGTKVPIGNIKGANEQKIVILSCDGHKYTDQLSPSFSFNYIDAIDMAVEIDKSIGLYGFSRDLIQGVLDDCKARHVLLFRKKVVAGVMVGGGLIYLIKNEVEE